MPFPGGNDPYIVRVGAVTDDGNPVSGASFKLENITKGTDTTKVSNETNSNISIPLSECGDWDLGDELQITASYDGKDGSSDHTTATEDNGSWNVGSILITTIIYEVPEERILWLLSENREVVIS